MLLKLNVNQTFIKAKSHEKKNQIEEARKLYQSILKDFPKNLRAQQRLSILNNLKEQIINKKLPQETIDQLVQLYNHRQFSVVVEKAQEILNQYPKTFIVWNILGASASELGMLDKAIEAYNKAISFKPDYAEAYNNLGDAFKDQGDLDNAVEACNKAISLKPNYAEAYNNLGNALKDLGKIEKAIEAYNKAISFKPDYAEAFNNLGIAYRDQRKTVEAIDSYKKSISLKPDLSGAHRNLSALIKYQENDPQISIVNDLLNLTTLNTHTRCELLYTFGKMMEDIGDYSAAFDNYVSGGALRKKILGYDLVQDQILFSKIKNTSKILDDLKFNESSEIIKNSPIFILGMPRSGTSLVEQIISSHSRVCGAGELKFVHSFGASIAIGSKPLTTDSLENFRKAYLNSLAKVSNGHQFVTDKMPHNFRYLGLLLKSFPDVKIIHVKRDAMATCWSNFKHYFSENGLGYCYDLNDTVEYFKLYSDLMTFWENLYPNRIYQLDYDKLTIEQEKETRKLIDYLGLDWESACLSPHKNERNVRTASNQQVRKKIYKGSSKGWHKFEPFLKNVFEDLKNYTNK